MSFLHAALQEGTETKQRLTVKRKGRKEAKTRGQGELGVEGVPVAGQKGYLPSSTPIFSDVAIGREQIQDNPPKIRFFTQKIITNL